MLVVEFDILIWERLNHNKAGDIAGLLDLKVCCIGAEFLKTVEEVADDHNGSNKQEICMNTQWAGKLSDPFFSLIVFSIYSGFIGAVLLLAPRIMLPQFGVHQEVNSFTFMLGMSLICLSFYYFAAGIARDKFFTKLTVYTRVAIPFVTMSLYRAGNVPFHYVLLGLLDACGGIWTFLALRKTPLVDSAGSQGLYPARNA